MLISEEWQEVDQLVDGEYMSQGDDTGFEAALSGVKLALAIISNDPTTREQAINYVFKFGNWQNLPLTREIKRSLYIRNYGEQEVAAMEEAREIHYEGGIS